jgi:nucleoside-diphosphate-sugar epimerase
LTATKVAVIGAAGHVGRYLVSILSEQENFQPVAVIRDKMAGRFLSDKSLDVRVGSITDEQSANSLVGDCGAIINLAYAGKSPAAIENNRNLVRFLARVQTANIVINASTISVHPAPFHTKHMDFKRPKPDSDYGVLKLASEREISRALTSSESSFYSLRIGPVYGRDQGISHMIFGDVSTPGFSLPFNGDLLSNAVSINRVCDAVVFLLKNTPDNGTYNLVDERQKTWRELYDLHTSAWNMTAVQTMSESDSQSLRFSYLNSAGFEKLPLGSRVRKNLKTILKNSPANNQFTKRKYLELRNRVPVNIDNKIATMFGRTDSDVVREKIADSDPVRPKPEWILIGDPVPGRNVPETPLTTSATNELISDLTVWYEDLASFQWDTNMGPNSTI